MSINRQSTVTLDHPGFVVSDLDQAQAFFIDVLGGEFVRGGAISHANGDDVSGLLGADPEASCRFAFIGFGDRMFELLEWTGPGRSEQVAGNSDAGGRHLAMKASDFEPTLARVSQFPGAKLRSRSSRGFVYVELPFGLELQLMP